MAYAVLLYAAMYGRKVSGNPFGAASLEWQSSSPPSFHNFDHKPVINDAYDFESMVYDETLGSYVLREFTDPKQVPQRQPVTH
jgi:cytochrome c oxidase subunit 1